MASLTGENRSNRPVPQGTFDKIQGVPSTSSAHFPPLSRPRLPLTYLWGAYRHPGADILLARHGRQIRSLRVDRRRGGVAAVLQDGSRDWAPNLIDPALPGSGKHEPLDSADRKMLGIITVATMVVFVLGLAVTGLICSTMDPATLASLTDSMNSMGTMGGVPPALTAP